MMVVVRLFPNGFDRHHVPANQRHDEAGYLGFSEDRVVQIVVIENEQTDLDEPAKPPSTIFSGQYGMSTTETSTADQSATVVINRRHERNRSSTANGLVACTSAAPLRVGPPGWELPMFKLVGISFPLIPRIVACVARRYPSRQANRAYKTTPLPGAIAATPHVFPGADAGADTS